MLVQALVFTFVRMYHIFPFYHKISPALCQALQFALREICSTLYEARNQSISLSCDQKLMKGRVDDR